MRNFTMPAAALMGRMSATERQFGRYLRNPDENGHAPAPAAPPAGDPDSDAAARAAAEEEVRQREAAAAAAAGGEPPADDAGDPPPSEAGNPPSDEAAKLLKEMMKWKDKAREAEARAKVFEGIDPEKAKAALAAQAEAERAQMEARGEYDRILAQVREDADNRVNAANTEVQALRDQVVQMQQAIEQREVVTRFATSNFIRENLVIGGDKVQVLYGTHFDTVDGKLIAYDKPRGASERTPLVDGRGEPLDFEAAIEKVIKADPDWERLVKSSLKRGSGSAPTGLKTSTAPDPTDSKAQIRAGLAAGLKKPALNLRGS